ncbi:DHA2 family efflux MFS transporter permease subunit [Sulfoacidibacillus thermotolerans]|uniref:DHA2 family efflux MFS transporter permease subunit n=1 Tax=Sulfoacidibacillus thermotolerans TaxID=1765684 RepID=UPI000D69D2E9|nr:DHA2 family efflux MFS transporter permease subunit [Sulfoacidibacillus thermotolerans]
MTFKERFGISFPALFAVVLGVFMAILDTTVVNVAIPKMMAVFNATQDDMQWVITAYLLVTGMLTPVSGYLGDRFGQKKIYLFALAVFTLGSALCGMAWSTESLIFFRVLQAVGGAMLMPVSMTILFSLSKPERRGTIMGIWGIALMFAPALGPTLSGYLVEYVDFRLIFYINVPIGIFSFFLVGATIPDFPARHTETLDLPGLLTSVSGFFCLLYALSEGPTDGWNSITIISLFFAAAVLLAMWVVIELTSENPMLDLRLFKRKVFTVSILTTSLLSVAMLGALFILPVFLQNGLGLTPLQTGLLTLPGALVTGILMPISGFLFDRIGARLLGVIGLLVLMLTTFQMVNMNYDWTFGAILMIYMFRQAGMGLAMMPLSTAGLNDVPRDKVSRATALQNTTRNIAGSIGTAFLSTVMQTNTTVHLAQLLQRTTVQAFQGFHVAGQLPTVFGPASRQVVSTWMSVIEQIAFEKGTQDAFGASAVIALIAWVAVFFIGKKRPPVGIQEGEQPHMMMME